MRIFQILINPFFAKTKRNGSFFLKNKPLRFFIDNQCFLNSITWCTITRIRILMGKESLYKRIRIRVINVQGCVFLHHKNTLDAFFHSFLI